MKKLQNKNVAMAMLALGLAAIVAVWQFLVWNDTRIIKADSKIMQKLDGESDYKWDVDLVEFNRDTLPTTKDWITISGWLMCQGKSVDTASIKIVLKKVGTDDYYILPTTMTQRTDVTEWANDGGKYDWSGFSVKIPHGGRIEIDRYDYEIYALYDLNYEGEKLVAFHTTMKEWKEDA